jgi:tripartite-type tricarboxylate transporter receptor subunit TctC
MLPTRRQIVQTMLASGAATVLSTRGFAADSYPSKPIKVIVSSAPGGPNDVPARLISKFLPSMLGQPVVVENRPGASGAIAVKEVGNSAPDGHTLLVGNTGTLAVLPAFSANATYDPTKLFIAVARMVEGFQVLLVHPSSPWASVTDLVEDAKANPGKLNYAHVGTGGLPHLTGAMFESQTGIKLLGVPYRGGPANLNAVLSRDVHMTFQDIGIALSMIQAERLRALAVSSGTRSPLLPSIPTMIEAGVPGYEVTTFFGIVAPAGTPASVVEKLNSAINYGMTSPEAQTTLSTLGLQFRPGSPADFAAMAAADLQRWRTFAAISKIQLD